MKDYILLAEDDIDDIEFLAEAMQKLDHPLHVLKSGQKTLSFLQNLEEGELPLVIILDYNLPEINGNQILAHLSDDERFKPIPKIVWSTSNSPMYEKECIASGALKYIVKPSDMAGFDAFVEIIAALIPH